MRDWFTVAVTATVSSSMISIVTVPVSPSPAIIILSSSSAAPFVIVLDDPVPPVVAAVPQTRRIQFPVSTESLSPTSRVITLPVTSNPQSVAPGLVATPSSEKLAIEHTSSPTSISKLDIDSAARVKSALKVNVIISAAANPVGVSNSRVPYSLAIDASIRPKVAFACVTLAAKDCCGADKSPPKTKVSIRARLVIFLII